MPTPLFEIFKSQEIAAYWEDVNAHIKDPMIGDLFFPVSKQTGLDLKWIKGANNLPVALQPSAFDTKAPLRDRIGVTEVSTEMPFFREAMRIGEKDRQDIETLLAKGRKFAEPIILRIYNDINNLVNGALVQGERMRMSLLYSGGIDIKASDENGRPVSYKYNYDAAGTWATDNKKVLAATKKWTVGNADKSNPIVDILEAKEILAEKRGVIATRMLINTTTLKGMVASESIKKDMNPVGATSLILTTADAQKYVENKTGLTIIVYDKMFKDEQGTDKKYYPDGFVTLLPSHILGNLWYGTTPEEFDLLGNDTDAKTTIVNTGVAITTLKEAHPVNVQTIVSEIVLPSFERMNDIFVLNVGK